MQKRAVSMQNLSVAFICFWQEVKKKFPDSTKQRKGKSKSKPEIIGQLEKNTRVLKKILDDKKLAGAFAGRGKLHVKRG
jgi:hypothetical protein